jgi:histidyl-tRNA synthetase
LDIIRGVDKLGKIGRDGVVKELSNIVPNQEKITKLIDYLSIKGKSVEVLNQAKILLESNPEGVSACDDLLTIIKFAKSFGYSEYIDLDLSLARGLEYYTGPIYEIYSQGNEDYGSIAGGGRYDEIIGLFGGENSPACGVSLGIERLMPLLKIKGVFNDIKLGIEVYIATINNNLLPNAIEIAQILRQNGISTTLSYKSGNLSRQLKFADNKSIPYVIVIGDKDLSDNSVSIRNMDSGEQRKVSYDKIVDYFKTELKN